MPAMKRRCKILPIGIKPAGSILFYLNIFEIQYATLSRAGREERYQAEFPVNDNKSTTKQLHLILAERTKRTVFGQIRKLYFTSVA